MKPLNLARRRGALLAAALWSGTLSMPVLAESPMAVFSALVAEGGITREAGVSYGPLPRQRLDVYRGAERSSSENGRPPQPSARPVVIFYYGGSWTQGERGLYRFVGAALAARGITTVIPDYRLFPEVRFPAFVEDAALAYRWAADNLSAGCAPIFVAGHSAGAHIAALLALDRRYRATAAPGRAGPAGWIGLAGPYAFDPTTWPSTKNIFAGVAEADTARPVAFVDKDSPPALVMHGRDDDVVRMFNLRDLAKSYHASGVAIETRELDGIAHLGVLLAIARPFRWRAPVLDDMVRFVEQQTARVKTASADCR